MDQDFFNFIPNSHRVFFRLEMRCHLFYSSNQNMVKIIKVLERSPERYTEGAVFDGCNCIKLFKARKC